MSGPVTEYLDLTRTAATRKAYRLGLARYLAFVRGDLVKVKSGVRRNDDRDLDAEAAAYLAAVGAGTRTVAKDLLHFTAKLEAEGYAPGTIVVNNSAVVGFLEDNGIALSRLEEKRVKQRLPRHRTVAEEEPITCDHLRAILPHLPIRDRAIALTMLASGGRIGEVLKLRLADVDLEGVPATVTFRAETTKTRERRVSFLTPEAADAVRAWVAGRNTYLPESVNRNRGLVTRGVSKPKRADDARLFPCDRHTFDNHWARALALAGLLRRCEVTGRVTRVPHGLRKRFRTALGAAAGPDLPEILMGHQGYLSTYRQWTQAELAEAYAEHSHVLCIAGGGGDLARRLAEQQATMDQMKSDNATLQERLAKLETDIQIAREVRTFLQERETGTAH